MMFDDLKTATSYLTKLYNEMEAINRLVEPSYSSAIEQMRRTMEPIYQQHLKVNRALELSSGEAVRIKDIFGSNQHWQDMLTQATATDRFVESLNALHHSWLDHLKPIQQDFSQLQASANLALCGVTLQLTATERLMAGIDFEAIRSRFQIEMPVMSGLESSIAHLASSYGGLAESFRDIADITCLPAFVLPGATREIYTTSLALDTLRPRDERDEEDIETEIQLIAEGELEPSGCIALLQQVDPGLVRPYIGARDALHGKNTDRARHILSSLRELWSHLLRRLAPDDFVVPWVSRITKHKDMLDDKGKPTRRARLSYVCRELDNDPLTDFLMHDIKALVKLLELYNRIHELKTELTDKQLRAILLRNDSSLMYILQISAENTRN